MGDFSLPVLEEGLEYLAGSMCTVRKSTGYSGFSCCRLPLSAFALTNAVSSGSLSLQMRARPSMRLLLARTLASLSTARKSTTAPASLAVNMVIEMRTSIMTFFMGTSNKIINKVISPTDKNFILLIFLSVWPIFLLKILKNFLSIPSIFLLLSLFQK